MRAQFGELRADSISRDHVFNSLGGRTVLQALEAGIDTKLVWREVCEAFDVPAAFR